ncbi:MAG: UvrD-helicase domain-containing protein [bacterium]
MRNERLIANAGSGKTHALTTRMIQLLARGVEPQKIAALTFTRKSAGEFLSAVFERLAEAALNPPKLAELRTSPFLEQVDAAQCRSILKQLTDQLGCLGMGTIDSLFARIACAFPLESGLAEDFSIAGEAQIDAAREKTLAELFAKESTASLADFIDLLRRITRNQGERDVFERLLRETQNLHEKYLATPPRVIWGDASAIWENGCDILKAGSVGPAADAFLEAVIKTHPAFSDEARGLLQENLELLKTLDSGGQWNPQISAFVKSRLCAVPKSGSLRITPKKEGWLELNEFVQSARLALLHATLKPEFESLLARSRSLHAFMQKFEAAYSALVRSAGLVTFGDITDSLARKANPQSREGEIWRNAVAYRIDQKFEHWLLDEFQDTSRPQWKILKTFIDEVVMDPEEQRSFFYVGDTKQAIYSWRGGDPDLFFEIFDEFNQIQQTLHDAPPLDQSWRSCPPILDFVNKIFSDLTPVKGVLEIPDAAAEKWRKAWTHHIASPKTQDIPGHAEWISVPTKESDDEEEGSTRDKKVLDILNLTQAWKRGLTCAVLTPDNNGVATLAALLQSRGIPVAVEGKTNPCVDNPLGAALLAALRMAASPDDVLSRAVVQGFPSASAWEVSRDWDFRNKTLESIARHGYAATIRAWIELAGLEGEPFLKERGAAFLLAAEEFDACRKPGDGIWDFLRFVEKRQTQENEASDVVRIMTVHQSKGLGFDMVIASGLDKKSRSHDGTRIALGPQARAVEWGVLLPAREFAEQDPTLRSQLDLDDADTKYGNLCKAYVALTRAKKALYVVTTELGDNTKSKNFARHLQCQFANSPAQFGEARWFEGYPFNALESAPQITSPAFQNPCGGTPKPVSPSSFQADGVKRTAFAPHSFDAAALGTEVHEVLAGIEWFENAQETPLDDLSKDALELLRRFLKNPIFQEVFSKPGEPCEVWRETAFDVMLDRQWISGVFDRVVIRRSQDGLPVSAIVYDFKTDHGSHVDIEELYAGQLEVYRKSACHLLGLPNECVRSRIICLR